MLSAFLTTTIITILAVILAYLTGSLDDELLDSLDRVVIDWVKRKGAAWNPIRTNSETPTLPNASTSPALPASSQARKQALLQFILALSDQQLVTGLAILVSGVANYKSLSTYEFSVMLSLAWFSSTTHLATLGVLKSHLKTHGIVRHIRVAGMLCVLVLLAFSHAVTIQSWREDDNTMTVECLFHSSGVYELSQSDVASTTLALAVIFLEYIVRIADLYVEHDLSLSPGVGLSQIVMEASAESQVKNLGILKKLLERRKHVLFQFLAGFHLYRRSFLSSLTGITFSFAYGISQVSLYRWNNAPPLTSETEYMGFGQIMAVFLLVLPFIAAAEPYYGTPSSTACLYKDPNASQIRPMTAASVRLTSHATYTNKQLLLTSTIDGTMIGVGFSLQA